MSSAAIKDVNQGVKFVDKLTVGKNGKKKVVKVASPIHFNSLADHTASQRSLIKTKASVSPLGSKQTSPRMAARKHQSFFNSSPRNNKGLQHPSAFTKQMKGGILPVEEEHKTPLKSRVV